MHPAGLQQLLLRRVDEGDAGTSFTPGRELALVVPPGHMRHIVTPLLEPAHLRVVPHDITIEIAPQQSITTVKYSGVAKAVPTGGIFDQLGVACHGTISTVGGPPVAIVHCVYVDKDGDKYVIRSMADKSESLGGTGKFTGMKGSGEFKVTRFPAIPGIRNVCVDGTFKYTLPD